MILVNISVTKNQITKIVVTNRVELAPDQAGIHARNNPLMLRIRSPIFQQNAQYNSFT